MFHTYFAILFTTATILTASPTVDVAGSKDHPLFPRMPGYLITQYKISNRGRGEFLTNDPAEPSKVVEGRKIEITYEPKAGVAPVLPFADPKIKPGLLAHMVQELEKRGGVMVHEGRPYAMFTWKKGTSEIWATVIFKYVGDGGGVTKYELEIIEK